MQTPLRYLASASCVAAMLLVGCMSSGIAHRLQEKSAALVGLDPEVRQHMEMGYVEITYTPDMVYVALGKPSRIEHKTAADGTIEVWVYKNMALPGNEGFRGLRYDSNFEITATVMNDMFDGLKPYRVPNPAQQQGSKTLLTGDGKGYGANLTAMDSATTLADMPMGTLYVFFYDGHVFKMTFAD